MILGGAGLVWWLVRDAARTDDSSQVAAALSLSRTYEWGFWAAVGVVVATGVGNLGALSPTVPGPDTGWGTTLSLKLVLVFVLLVGSVVRTVLAVDFSERTEIAPEQANSRRLVALRSAYAITAVWLLVIVGFAEVLAHG